MKTYTADDALLRCIVCIVRRLRVAGSKAGCSKVAKPSCSTHSDRDRSLVEFVIADATVGDMQAVRVLSSPKGR